MRVSNGEKRSGTFPQTRFQEEHLVAPSGRIRGSRRTERLIDGHGDERLCVAGLHGDDPFGAIDAEKGDSISLQGWAKKKNMRSRFTASASG